jgi:hypothetical protein
MCLGEHVAAINASCSLSQQEDIAVSRHHHLLLRGPLVGAAPCARSKERTPSIWVSARNRRAADATPARIRFRPARLQDTSIAPWIAQCRAGRHSARTTRGAHRVQPTYTPTPRDARPRAINRVDTQRGAEPATRQHASSYASYSGSPHEDL